jgi:hypothetical protein
VSESAGRTVYCCPGGRRYEFFKATSGRWVMPAARGRRQHPDTRVAFERATGRRLASKESDYAAVGELVSSQSARFAATYIFRYRLWCKKCRTTVSVWGENLDSILDDGVSEIRLADLEAKVSGSATP